MTSRLFAACLLTFSRMFVQLVFLWISTFAFTEHLPFESHIEAEWTLPYFKTMRFPKFGTLFFILYLCSTVNAARILALFSSLSYADHLVFRGYVTQLVQRGHSLVVMTPFPGHYQYPETESVIELDVGVESSQYWEEYKGLLTNVDDHFPRLRALNELSLKIAIAQLRSKQMTALFINPNIKFDLVVTEADVPVFYAVAEKYGTPHIAITTTNGKIHQYEAKGNPIHPILYLDVNSLNNGVNMTRWEKIIEFYRYIQTKNEYFYNYLPLNDLAARKIFNLKRDLQELEQEIDLLFVASNPILVGNRPTVPAITFVDRLHIKPGLHLPESMQKFLDSSTKGVVYFNLGALQESETLAPLILQSLTDAFREVPYTILWKIGNTTMINKPDNVVAQAWFPQQEVLAHPNVKAFITNGGTRSLEEAVYYQVPIIGFPLQKSRKNFIAQITKYGAGEILDPYNLDKDTLKETITAVVTDGKYKQAVSKLKDMVFDPLLSGPENAVWWTDYILRNKGARHLRSPAVGISFIKYFMLDFIFYLCVVTFLAIFLAYLILRFIIRRLQARIFGRPEEIGGKFKVL